MPRAVIVTVTVALAAASTFNAILGQGEIAILLALAAPLGVSAFGFARAGQNEAAMVLVSLVLITVVTLTLAMSPLGFHDLAISGYAGTLAIAALLVARRTFLALTGLALGAGTLVFGLEQVGLTGSFLEEPARWPSLLGFLLVTAVTAALARAIAETLFGSIGAAERAAMVDPATGLANRGAFVAQARALLGAGGRASGAILVLADLEGFRRVNMVVGHAAADRLLIESAARILALDGAGAIAGRIGDDEFALLMPGRADADAARYLGQRVESALEFQFAGVRVRASVGVARFPEDADTVDMLFQFADGALEGAKRERHAATARAAGRA